MGNKSAQKGVPAMLGALIGDIAGSIYEWENIKSKDFPLVQPGCRMTDDSVMTAAVASAILMSDLSDLADFRTNVVGEMQRLGRFYPNLGYGPRFEKWLQAEKPKPYGSLGNGSAMRVSPAAWAAESMGQCLALARASAEVTHNHPDGIAGAEVTAGAVYLARQGAGKKAIREYVTRYYPLNFTLDEIRESYRFDVSCAGSVPQAMEAFLEADSFEDAIRGAISIGGDSDTIADIAGAVAAAHYGIPREIRDTFLPFIDGEVRDIYDRFIQRY